MIFKLTLPFYFLFFFLENGFAQNFQIGVKGGLSLPNLSSSGGSDVAKGYKTISGPISRWFLITDFLRNFLLKQLWNGQHRVDRNQVCKPFRHRLTWSNIFLRVNAQYLYANFTSTVRLQYLMLPVLLKYNMNLGNSGHWKLYIDGGPYGGLLMEANASAVGSSKVYFDKEETQQVGTVTVEFDSTGDIKNQLHKGNFRN